MKTIGIAWSDPRVDRQAKKLRKWSLTLDAAIDLLALYMVAAKMDEEINASNTTIVKTLELLLKHHKDAQVRAETSASIASTIAQLSMEKNTRTREKASARAKLAADALHNKPGGSVSKREAIQEIWASGKFANRSLCAEQECAGLGMSFDAARKALRNTPNSA